MKTIITSSGKKTSSAFDLRFGRAAWFCLYDHETENTTFHENYHVDDGHGAGQKAAELVFELGADRVISGDFGPKAKDILDRLKVQMVIIENDNQSVGDVIKKLKREV
jgi:predicted Fe-Mo cluster-binding NifX family protein